MNEDTRSTKPAVTAHGEAIGHTKREAIANELLPLRRRLLWRAGIVLVPVALMSAFVTFLVIAGYTAVVPTNAVVLSLFGANIAMIMLLLGLVLLEGWHLLAARRARLAGSRLHIRIVALFSVVAAVPSIIMAVIAIITIERTLTPAFMEDMRGFIANTGAAANFYREAQCASLLRDVELTASDLSSATSLYQTNPSVFHDYFVSRAHFLGLEVAVLMRDDGTILSRAQVKNDSLLARPDEDDFADARAEKPLCLALSDQSVFIAVRPIAGLAGTYLYAGRAIDPFSAEFAGKASSIMAIFDSFEAHRGNIELAFGLMYTLLALIMLLSAIWLGLSFATRLVHPIRRLIRAADAVGLGNLYVQVPVQARDGDLAHLGNTFNKMTSELRAQQNRLIAANATIDERRQFIEAVLAGVPAAVIGVSPEGAIDVINTAAEALMPRASLQCSLTAIMPELEGLLVAAREQESGIVQGQISLVRQGKERVYNVRITRSARTTLPDAPPALRQRHKDDTEGAVAGLIVTLDDMTDLVAAQRSSAWADVARRIAHEIKNPLTPIQLSAERLKRRYGRTLTEGKEIFDQCIDTIIRQVEDIKRMVDEFSSFARMPKARPQRENLADILRETMFMMRLAYPSLTLVEEFDDAPIALAIDRRLFAQAVTNLIKNAAEAILEFLPAASNKEDALPDAAGAARARVEPKRAQKPGIIKISLKSPVMLEDGMACAEIKIMDNGRGFPKENRQALLEPYVTTRAEGTGLGLPIVAKIMEEHGGKIFLEDGLPHPASAQNGDGCAGQFYGNSVEGGAEIGAKGGAMGGAGFGACVRLMLPLDHV